MWMNGIRIVVAALAFGIAAVAMPLPADAGGDPIDCTEGCEIVTCNSSGVCTVWDCSADGCEPIGFYTRRKQTEQQSLVPTEREPNPRLAFARVCEASQPCAFKVCEGGTCEVSVFDGKTFVLAARVDDVASLVVEADGMLKQPATK